MPEEERKKQLSLEYKNADLDKLWYSYCEILNLVKIYPDYFVTEIEIIRKGILKKSLEEKLDFSNKLEILCLEYEKKLAKISGETALYYLNMYKNLEDNEIAGLVHKDSEVVAVKKLLEELIVQRQMFEIFIFE